MPTDLPTATAALPRLKGLDGGPALVPARPGWQRYWPGRPPQPCVLCGSWGRQGLCAACQARFVGIRPAACPRCALASPGHQVCGDCQRQPPPYTACIAAADYGFPWDGLVGRFKFQGQPELAGLLAAVMAGAVLRGAAGAGAAAGAATAGAAGVEVIVPVPLSDARLAERGYNQAWELARRLAARLRLPALANGLLRLRDTPHQVGLTRQARQRNLRDAMWVAPAAAAQLAGRRVALVDDVLTTGVTAAAASQALLAAGAASVQVWVLARTPPPER